MKFDDIFIDPRLEESIRKLSDEPDLASRLQKLTQQDFSETSQSEIYKSIKSALIYMPLPLTVSRPYNIDRFPVYRVRTGIDENIENINLSRTFSYPNPCFCKLNGRANIKYNPVLYCSDIPGTALAESKANVGDILYLTEWYIRCHRSDTSICFLPADLPNNNTFINIAQGGYSRLAKYFEANYSKELSGKVKTIINFLAAAFTWEQHPYSLSSCLANHYLYETKGIDYVIYPSYQTTSNSCNLAFNPNFVDEFFRFSRVFKLKITEEISNGSAMELLMVGEYFSSYIHWRAPVESDGNMLLSSLTKKGTEPTPE